MTNNSVKRPKIIFEKNLSLQFCKCHRNIILQLQRHFLFILAQLNGKHKKRTVRRLSDSYNSVRLEAGVDAEQAYVITARSTFLVEVCLHHVEPKSAILQDEKNTHNNRISTIKYCKLRLD